MSKILSIEQLTKMHKLVSSDGSFNRLFTQLEAVHLDEKLLRYKLQVTQPDVNSFKTLHGGYVASLVDYVSGMQLISHHVLKHVSVELNVSFFSPAKIDTWLHIDSRLLRKGKNLAFMEVLIRDEQSGKLYAKGKHTKFLLDDD